MLEVKDKNRSAVKCQLCLAPPNQRLLETEWGRYKYAILERSPQIYQELRTLLKDKQDDLAIPFYRLVESALALPGDRGRAVNALEHVWGYFSDCASPTEQKRYASFLARYQNGSARLSEGESIALPTRKNLPTGLFTRFLLLYALTIVCAKKPAVSGGFCVVCC